jgi:hypothetical protein
MVPIGPIRCTPTAAPDGQAATTNRELRTANREPFSRLPGRHFLQIPGPTNLPDRVLRAIDRPTGVRNFPSLVMTVWRV